MKDLSQYFAILEIQESATELEVCKAYRDLIKVWHPDRFAHDPALQRKAEEKTKNINKAYQQLLLHCGSERKTPNTSHSWICPKCLMSNSKLTCNCGFAVTDIELRTFSINQTAASLLEMIIYSKKKGDLIRVAFLSGYLLKRFAKSSEADLLREKFYC